jgi:tRNA uridine 5-carboxymethylaminomethyl modification enzyme
VGSFSFDIVVIGAGHAGVEAAAAAARLGRRVAMVTFSRDQVGRLSCNPAIGGLAKGCLVRELDALGGLMARATDAATIQFRLLNTSKGLATRSSRAQVDVVGYPDAVQALLAEIPSLTLVEGEAAELLTEGGRVVGVALASGDTLRCEALILTTGTFLRGLLHRGEHQTRGGRVGEAAAWRLADSMRDLGLRLGRLKTGTPPRLKASTIHWALTEPQDDTQGRFSYAPVLRRLPTARCFLVHTTEEAHALIRENIHRAPMYAGQIEGVGPRYCPSIEDKVMRFGHRERHLLFLEPESHQTERIYVNGLSTSLPDDVQRGLLDAIPALRGAEILQHGYAVEYDFADPTALGPDLQHKDLPGLYLAGQLNGTSGYEEAAVQGFIAGVSAARGEPLRLGRDRAMIGVLIDDLISKGVGGEPYRMFSSRAEHRLVLREDNADRRLMPIGRALGLINDADWAAFEARQEAIARGHAALSALQVRPDPTTLARIEAAGLGGLRQAIAGDELLRRPEASWSALAALFELPTLSDDEAEQVETEVKYAGYIRREEARTERTRRLEARSLESLDLTTVPGLSAEVRERLLRHRPPTLAAAARLPGVTPAALDVLALWVSR